MYLFGALLVLGFGLYVSPGDISEVPFAQLTLKKLVGSFVSWGCYIYALVLTFKSLGEDRIWPWRWTLPYLGNLVFRAGMSALYVWGAFYVVEKKQLDGWLFTGAMVLLFILLFFTFFSSELEVFKEKSSSEHRGDGGSAA